jgi:hypothetical protein
VQRRRARGHRLRASASKYAAMSVLIRPDLVIDDIVGLKELYDKPFRKDRSLTGFYPRR